MKGSLNCCPICKSKDTFPILSKPNTFIWTGKDDTYGEKKKYPARLIQCDICGHIYQTFDKELEDILNSIYTSDSSVISTPMGVGNWGKLRSDEFLEHMNPDRYRSSIEIGCGNGFLTEYLSRQYKWVVGIDPSCDAKSTRKNTQYIKDMVNEDHKFRRSDIIFSAGALEHIYDLDVVMEFCSKHTNDIYFLIPDIEWRVESGDPSLFVHEHIHYFTESSIYKLFERFGYGVEYRVYTDIGLYIKGNKSTPIQIKRPRLFESYSSMLNKHLDRIKDYRIFHGVNNTYSNIMSWLNMSRVILVDNDETKIGKMYLGNTVNGVADIHKESDVLVLPYNFYEDIKNQYIRYGFNEGNIKCIL